MKIYVASSWRNEARQQAVVTALREAGHEVYDFRNPAPGDHGFGWRQCAPQELLSDPQLFRDTVLTHPIAQAAFANDMGALKDAQATVLVLPCGRSAHLELGYATGAGQRTVVLLDDPMSEPELMYLMNTTICLTVQEVVDALALKRFFRFDDDGATYDVVARDTAHAVGIIRSGGAEFGNRSLRVDEALAAGEVTVRELSFEHAMKVRCDTGDTRGMINLSACNIGEWFSSEY